METPSQKKWIYVVLAFIGIVIIAFLFGQKWLASYYINLGRKNLAAGDYRTAETNFTTALKFAKSNPVIFFYLGNVAMGPLVRASDTPWPQADFSKAATYYDTAVILGLDKASSVAYSSALENAGFAYWSLKQYDQSDEKYRAKIAAFPDSSFWARFFVAQDDFERLNKAQEALDVLVKAPDASDAETWFLYRIDTLIARLYFYEKDLTNARKYAELAISNAADSVIDGNVQIAHLVLAQELATQKKLKEALVEYDKAATFAKKDTGSDETLRCGLSKIYLLSGDSKKAAQTAESVVSAKITFDYPSSICIDTLVRTNLAAKNKAEAKKYMQQYLAATDTFEQKNIFVMRNREEFAKILSGL